MSRLRRGLSTRLAGVGYAPVRHGAAEGILLTSLGPRAWRSAQHSGGGAPSPQMRSEVYREYWDDAAAACGADIEDLGDGRLRLRRGTAHTEVWDNFVPLDHPVSLRVAGSRRHTHAALEGAGLRVPRHVLCPGRELGPALRFLDEVDACVVKPAAFTGAGSAVTCGVRTADDLLTAVVYARRHGQDVIVEEQAYGQEHRVLVLDGSVLGDVLRRPPRLLGDGRSSVAQLVAQCNAARRAARGREGLFRLTLDLDLLATQRATGRTLRSVVPAGEQFVAKTAVNENGPAENSGAAEAPSEVAELAVTAAAAIGLRWASVEVIVPQDGSPPVVLELNSTPGLHYHYQVAEGSQRVHVGRPLLEALLTDASSDRQE